MVRAQSPLCFVYLGEMQGKKGEGPGEGKVRIFVLFKIKLILVKKIKLKTYEQKSRPIRVPSKVI